MEVKFVLIKYSSEKFYQEVVLSREQGKEIIFVAVIILNMSLLSWSEMEVPYPQTQKNT